MITGFPFPGEASELGDGEIERGFVVVLCSSWCWVWRHRMARSVWLAWEKRGNGSVIDALAEVLSIVLWSLNGPQLIAWYLS
jgi:hypothetical protein